MTTLPQRKQPNEPQKKTNQIGSFSVNNGTLTVQSSWNRTAKFPYRVVSVDERVHQKSHHQKGRVEETADQKSPPEQERNLC